MRARRLAAPSGVVRGVAGTAERSEFEAMRLPDGAAVDWTFLAVTASIASAVLLQLRLRSIRSEVHARHILAEENQRLELVLESSRLGLWDWDMQTDTMVCDDRWADILGFQLEDLAPLSIQTEDRLVHPDDTAASDALFDDHVHGRVPYYDLELRMRHRHGHWVWVHDRGRIVEWSPDGLPLRVTGTLEDVSEAHSAAERMAAAEEESRLAMDNSAIGMCLVSPDGRFLRVNPAIGRMLGRPADELLLLSLSDVTHPDDADVIVAAQREILTRRRSAHRLVTRYVAAGGRVIWGTRPCLPCTTTMDPFATWSRRSSMSRPSTRSATPWWRRSASRTWEAGSSISPAAS